MSPAAGAQRPDSPASAAAPAVSLRTIAREWTRIGIIGFGGPPTHIALFEDWSSSGETG